MSKLNAVLGLVKYEDSLEMPVLLHDTIWGGVDMNAIISSADTVDLIRQCPPYNDLRRISDAIVKQAPGWLQYGVGGDYMQQDIMRLLSCQPEIHGMAST